MPLYYEDQYFTTTLSVIGGINASVTTGIVAQSVSGVTDTTKPGIALLNYSDPLDTNACEWFTYTSINSTTKTFVGVTRGAEGFSAKSHSNGVTIAFPHSRSHINNLVDALSIGGDPTNGVTTTLDEDDMASDSATAVPTQQSVKAYVDTNAPSTDGWSDTGETWTYASATTFTVSGDVTTKYQKGDKVKLTQTTVKYFYIIGVSESGGTTTDTITGGSTYTLANAAITDNYFSKQDNPQGFPGDFPYTPSYTGFSSAPSTLTARFHLTGSMCYTMIRTNTGTSNANTFRVSAPITAATVTNGSWRVRPANFVDNGANSTTADFVLIDSEGTDFVCAKNTSSTGWTTSGNKGGDWQIFYKI